VLSGDHLYEVDDWLRDEYETSKGRELGMAGMIRARIRRDGRGIELGYFKTKAEVAAVQEVARAILDEWDEVKSTPPKLPSPNILIDMIHQGAYDITIEALAAAVTRRLQMTKRMDNNRQRHWAGKPAMEDRKWQAIRETKERQVRYMPEKKDGSNLIG